VVLGGVHPSVLPEEAKRHCDAVAIGEAEPVWSLLLEDREAGRLQPYYRATTNWDLDEGPLPRRELCRSRSVLGVVPVVASRGCPYSCEFCCVKSIFGRKIRHVGTARVVEDIQRTGSEWIMFLDDNIVGDQRYAESLFKALGELRIKWGGQASISFVKNQRLLDLAADTGCVGLFIGLESVSEEKVRRMSKGMRSLEETERAVSRVMESGIFLHASLVFGFDDDEPSVFDDTLRFLERTRIPSVTFNILTPYPGTELHAQLRSENRILTVDWRYYDHCTPVFVPRRMSPADLYQGYWRAKRNFYSVPRILSRMPANRRTPLLFFLANVGLMLGLRGEQKLVSERNERLGLHPPGGVPHVIPAS
jgi:radical SAM superfamily enzyme YgiQ (UPF0313 family)